MAGSGSYRNSEVLPNKCFPLTEREICTRTRVPVGDGKVRLKYDDGQLCFQNRRFYGTKMYTFFLLHIDFEARNRLNVQSYGRY